MIIVAVDIAKDKHDCFITNTEGEVREYESFSVKEEKAVPYWLKILSDNKSMIVTASAAAQKAVEKPRKRSRIKTVNLVYSANQLKAKKIEKQTTVTTSNSLFDDLSAEEKEMLEQSTPAAIDSPSPAVAEADPSNCRQKSPGIPIR